MKKYLQSFRPLRSINQNLHLADLWGTVFGRLYLDALQELDPTLNILQGYLRKGLALQKLQEFDGSVICLAQGLAYETQSRQILSSIVETVLLSSLRGKISLFVSN